MQNKTDIPTPPNEEVLEPDHTDEYIKEWKRLFNAIRPGVICAYVKGDEGFPPEYKTETNMSRLSDAYRVNYRIVVKGFPPEDDSQFTGGSELYFCEKNSAFSSDWVSQVDENFDTLEPFGQITWEEMLKLVVTNEKNRRLRIPEPPKENI